MNFKKEKLLIIAPHADDEILGCYGLINKIKKNGGEVYIQILSLGGYSRIDSKNIKKETWKKEFLKVSKIMEIDDYDIMFYNNKIRHLDEFPQSKLIGYLESKSKISLFNLQPTIVAIPTIFSTHQDHTQAYKVAIAALRTNSQTWYNPPKMIISYESPEYYFWSSYSEFGKFSPNLYLKLTKTDIEKKVECLKVYQSQLKQGKRDKEKIFSLGSIRGNEIGYDYAEAFQIHRYLL